MKEREGSEGILHGGQLASPTRLDEITGWIQHLSYGTGDAGGFAGDDEFEAIVGDEGYVR